jgi:hypothetical protein
MLERGGKLYYSTKEAAERLGIKQTSIGDAIWRGVLAATEFPDILHRRFIEADELERYRRENQGRRGWQKRKELSYQPNTRRAAYQRAYRERERKEQEAAAARKTDGGL